MSGHRRWKTRTSVRRYILNVMSQMLENEFNEPDVREGWMFGGVENQHDREMLATELRIYIAELLATARKLGERPVTVLPEPPEPSPDWRKNMDEALAARGCKTQREWAEKFPGEHCMFHFRDFRSCALCGAVEVRDPRKQGRCRGVVHIELRAADGTKEPL